MIYVMSARMYWNYIDGTEKMKGMTHEELVDYLNRTIGLRGKIEHIEIVGG